MINKADLKDRPKRSTVSLSSCYDKLLLDIVAEQAEGESKEEFRIRIHPRDFASPPTRSSSLWSVIETYKHIFG